MVPNPDDAPSRIMAELLVSGEALTLLGDGLNEPNQAETINIGKDLTDPITGLDKTIEIEIIFFGGVVWGYPRPQTGDNCHSYLRLIQSQG